MKIQSVTQGAGEIRIKTDMGTISQLTHEMATRACEYPNGGVASLIIGETGETVREYLAAWKRMPDLWIIAIGPKATKNVFTSIDDAMAYLKQK